MALEPAAATLAPEPTTRGFGSEFDFDSLAFPDRFGSVARSRS